MKKILTIILIIALLLPILTVSAFAADDIDNAGMLDGIGGFFKSIIGYIVDGFNNTISAVKNGISAIGDGIAKIINVIINATKDAVNAIAGFFANLFRVIGEAISGLLKGLYDLFVPSDNYFDDVLIRLETALNNKLGGILSLTEYLKDRFSRLSTPANTDNMLVIEFPQGHIFGGTRIDLLKRIRPNLPLFRGLLSGLMVLVTTAYAYKRVRSMINT